MAAATQLMMPDLHAVLSVEDELQRTIMLEVEFLPDIDQITDVTLQRITAIAMRHLGSYPTLAFGSGGAAAATIVGSHPKTNKIPAADEFQRNLHSFDRANRIVFLERLDSYLSSIFDGTVRPMENLMMTTARQDDEHQKQHLRTNQRECYVRPMVSKSNEMLRRNVGGDSMCVGVGGGRHADIVLDATTTTTTAATSTTAEDDNEDLAEADQICSSDELYPTEDDLESHSVVGGDGGAAVELDYDRSGAVGGLVNGRRQLQHLPDLANVSSERNYIEVSNDV